MKHLKRINELFLETPPAHTDNISEAKKIFKKIIKPFWGKEYGEAKFEEWYQGEFEEGYDASSDFATSELRNMIKSWKVKNPDYEKMAELFGFEDEGSDSFNNAVEAILEKYEDRIVVYYGHVFIIPEQNADYRDIDELKSLIQEYIEKENE